MIWTHEGYGKEVLQLFMNELSEEQRATVELVTCDGAKWIRSARKPGTMLAKNVTNRSVAVEKLYEKVKRNKAGILSTIRLEMSNARIEATNNKIKLLIRTAYGFRNMENMLSLIMLSCSYVEVKIAYKWSAENKESLNKAA